MHAQVHAPQRGYHVVAITRHAALRALTPTDDIITEPGGFNAHPPDTSPVTPRIVIPVNLHSQLLHTGRHGGRRVSGSMHAMLASGLLPCMLLTRSIMCCYEHAMPTTIRGRFNAEDTLTSSLPYRV